MSQPTKRPGAVTAAAVVLFIVGSLSLLCGIVTGGGVAVFALNPPRPDAPKKADAADPFGFMFAQQDFVIKESPAYYPVHITGAALDLLLGIAQIACGVGLLRMSSASRWMAILFTLVKLLTSLAFHVYTLMYEFPAQERFAAANPLVKGGPDGAGAMSSL